MIESEFEKIRYGKHVKDFSIKDPFYLESFDDKEYWEYQLNDIHSFIGKAKVVTGWLISKKLKKIFSGFKISQPHYLYSSQLLYQNVIYKYFIFQFSGKSIYRELTSYIDFSKSEFINPSTQELRFFLNIDHFIEESEELYFEKDIDFVKKKIVLKDDLDFFPMQSFFKDNLVSERLKEVIENEFITGFEFSELNYEVVVKKS
ncbi:hypothetical protein NU08_2783 [Flavobacterium anhuiense]|uniref:Uncharacterized protein n=2 Tax=Flavobacterium anhuiense TaxID=459526 RepID=A0A444VXB3_9FLAO|nr:hypothetical protein NU08_2783 [Flavobacterium anhuiense]